MKLIRLLALAIVCTFAPQSQLLAGKQEVVLGEDYQDIVYYNLKNGVVKTVPLDSWDIGFEIEGFTASIIANGGKGVQVFVVPHATGEEWATIDTNGLAADWTAYINSTRTWHSGAFNLGADPNTGDFGWGEYNMATHTVSGTTVFVVLLPDGAVKKFMVEKLKSGVYTIRYANLDNSEEQRAEINKADFVGRNFGYYSLSENQTVDVEPDTDTWDLVFSKYIGLVGQNADLPYPVTGIRVNRGLEVAKAEDVDVETVKPDAYEFEDNISGIGHDWKRFDLSEGWILQDRLSYFVRARGGDIYKLVFTEFSGSGSGVINFNLFDGNYVTDVFEDADGVAGYGVFPNPAPAQAGITLFYSVEDAYSSLQLEINSLMGQRLLQRRLATGFGEYRLQIAAGTLATGVYMVNIVSNTGLIATWKLIVH